MHPLRHLVRLEIRDFAESLLFGKFARPLDHFMETARENVAKADSLAAGSNQDHILLACHPRGGSTWLAELMTTIPSYELIYEPLSPHKNRLARENGFSGYNYFSQSEPSASQKAYLSGLFRGRRICAGHLGPYRSLGRIYRMILSEKYVFKCICANMILGEIYEVSQPKIVLFLRHPCAVVASQLDYPAWRDFHWEDAEVQNAIRPLLEDHPAWAPVWSDVCTPEEALAFIWGARTLLPLSHSSTSEWCIETYENLLVNSTDTVRSIFDYLGEPLPNGVHEQLREQSASVAEEGTPLQAKEQLRKWKRRLTPEQVGRILTVTRRMGCDFYSEDVYPDRERLSAHR